MKLLHTDVRSSVTLSAGVATDLLTAGSAGDDLAGADVVQIALKNLDVSNAIGTVTISVSPTGALFAASSTTYSIAAGATKRLTIRGFVGKLRVIGTSASGASCQVDLAAFLSQSDVPFQISDDGEAALPGRSAAAPVYFSAAGIAAKVALGPWCQTNIGASQSAVQIGFGATGASQLDCAMSYAGYLAAISATYTVAPAGSTHTISVFKNGALLDATAILTVTAGATLARSTTFTIGLAALAFAAGDKLGVAITTDGSWTATTSDVAVELIVAM